jgi:hypothetical protein
MTAPQLLTHHNAQREKTHTVTIEMEVAADSAKHAEMLIQSYLKGKGVSRDYKLDVKEI